MGRLVPKPRSDITSRGFSVPANEHTHNTAHNREAHTIGSIHAATPKLSTEPPFHSLLETSPWAQTLLCAQGAPNHAQVAGFGPPLV